MSDDNKPINRRSFLARIGAGAAIAGGALNLITGTEASAITDNDPGDAAGRTGYTDRDANDPSGNGRGRRRRRSGLTDSDPGDAVGNGRG